MLKRKRVVFLNDTSGENHVGCSLVVDNFRKICRNYRVDIVGTFTRRELTSDTPPRISSSNVDLVVVNGEGSFHHSPAFTDALLSFGSSIPKILVNSIWEKMFCCEELLSHFSFISVRESSSYQEICKSISKDKVDIVPDLVFYDNKELIKSHTVGFSDSVMVHIRDELKKKENYFPMQDHTLPDVLSYISWMKGLDLFVTGRFHGVCLAMILGIPFLAIPSNAHKIEGILKDCNCPELVIRELSEIGTKRSLALQSGERTKKYVNSSHGKISRFYEKVFRSI